MAAKSAINPKTCKRCGLCAAICPMGIPHKTQTNPAVVELRADRLDACIKCGHCMAICPTQSVNIAGLSYEAHLFDLPPVDLESEVFFDLLTTRRSIRVFKDTPVPRELLEKIVQAITLAPMGFTPHKVTVTVVQRRETIEKALPLMVQTYENLGRWMKNPLTRFMMRRRTSRQAFNSLRNHVLPSLRFRLPDMKAGQGDTITRGAPVLLLFHAHREAESHTEDALIDLTYGLLAAHALGLGATALSLVPPVVERVPELRTMFEIPPEHKVLASMIVGYPKYRFKRAIRRELAGVHWL